jgi:hypothetical protein
VIEYLFQIESKRYPFYQVVEIEVISNENDIISYHVCIDSKVSPGWRKWEPTRTINLSKLVAEMRDDKLKKILE